MTEAEWLACRDSRAMVAFLRGDGVTLVDQMLPEQREEMRQHLMRIADGRKQGYFACACCRMIWLLLDDRSRQGVEATERYLDDELDEGEWSAAARRAMEARLATQTKPGEAVRSPARIARAAARSAELTTFLVAVAFEECAMVAALGEIVPTLPDAWAAQAALFHDIAGNPFRPVGFTSSWRTSTVESLTRQMYDSRDFSAMPILADALQDAGCDNDNILSHCRDPRQVHVRGCWVVDLVLNKA